MKATVLAGASVKGVLKKFVFAELYTDRLNDSKWSEVDKENRRIQKERFASVALPLYVILGPDDKERSRLTGMSTTGEFLEFLKKGLAAESEAASANGN